MAKSKATAEFTDTVTLTYSLDDIPSEAILRKLEHDRDEAKREWEEARRLLREVKFPFFQREELIDRGKAAGLRRMHLSDTITHIKLAYPELYDWHHLQEPAEAKPQ